MYRILYISTVGNNKAAVYRYVEKGYMITDQISCWTNPLKWQLLTRPYRPISKFMGPTRDKYLFNFLFSNLEVIFSL